MREGIISQENKKEIKKSNKEIGEITSLKSKQLLGIKKKVNFIRGLMLHCD